MNSAAASIVADVAKIEEFAQYPIMKAGDLEVNLQRVYQQIVASNLANYDIAEVRAEALPLMQRLFELRLKLRERIDVWQQSGYFTPGAQAALRDVFRASRYASDLIGEVYCGNARKGDDEPSMKAFDGGATHVRIAAKFAQQGVTFESGDVLLVRGAIHNSAAIARIGKVDSQFSHVGIVYVDKKGQRFIVEALIAEGAVITPLDKALAHDNVRALLFRYRDPVLAARAAQLIHRRVRHSRRWYGTKILYDFSMALNSYKRLFCSKLVRQAYDKASGGRVKLPTYPTSLEGANLDFLQRIGVTTETTFAPGDMELEQDFQVVAEWNDYRMTPVVRMHDLGMTKMMEWMEKDHWVFKEDFSIRLISWLGRIAGLMSEDAKNLIASMVPKVPVNMGTRTIATIAMLHKTAESLYEHLKPLDDAQIAATGRPLHPLAVFAELDKVRQYATGHIGYLWPPADHAPAGGASGGPAAAE